MCVTKLEREGRMREWEAGRREGREGERGGREGVISHLQYNTACSPALLLRYWLSADQSMCITKLECPCTNRKISYKLMLKKAVACWLNGLSCSQIRENGRSDPEQ